MRRVLNAYRALSRQHLNQTLAQRAPAAHPLQGLGPLVSMIAAVIRPLCALAYISRNLLARLVVARRLRTLHALSCRPLFVQFRSNHLRGLSFYPQHCRYGNVLRARLHLFACPRDNLTFQLIVRLVPSQRVHLTCGPTALVVQSVLTNLATVWVSTSSMTLIGQTSCFNCPAGFSTNLPGRPSITDCTREQLDSLLILTLVQSYAHKEHFHLAAWPPA